MIMRQCQPHVDAMTADPDPTPPARRGRGRPRSVSPLAEVHVMIPDWAEMHLAEGARLHGTMTGAVIAALVATYPLDVPVKGTVE